MNTLNDWDGNVQKSTLQYTIEEVSEQQSFPEEDKITISKIGEFVDQADKTDYIFAGSCGILTGMLDVFWVGEFSLLDVKSWGNELTNRFVIKVAQLNGCAYDDLRKCIAYLEEKAPIPSDSVTSKWGGGTQHHLRDFAHHMSLAGLLFSVLSQFTGKSYGVDKNGDFKIIDLYDKKYIGVTFLEKVYNGIVIWMLHLVSDMAGSHKNAGGGTGIPGPVLSIFKELSAIPFIRRILVELEEKNININVFFTRLFSGKVLKDANGEAVKFDLRAEIGINLSLTKQELPNLFNKVLIYAFYFVKRFCVEISRVGVESVGELGKLDPIHFIPKMNRCIARMLTVSSGVFCAIDFSHAAAKAFIIAPGNTHEMFTQLVIRLNFAGIGNFAVTIKNDRRVSKNKEKIMAVPGPVGDDKTTIIANYSVENRIIINFEADNSALYDYTFYTAKKEIGRSYERFKDAQAVEDSMVKPLFITEYPEESVVRRVISSSEYLIIDCLIKLLKQLLSFYGIDYFTIPREKLNGFEERHLPFYRVEDNAKVGYLFTADYQSNINPNGYVKKLGLDKICSVALVEIAGDNFPLEKRKFYEKNYNGLIEYVTIEEFFQLFPAEEYILFKEKFDVFNSEIRDAVGLTAVISPGEYEKQLIRQNLYHELTEFDIRNKLLDSGIYVHQIDALEKNFCESGCYELLYSDDNAIDSLILSEWRYHHILEHGGYEGPVIMAGYRMCIEYLLFDYVHATMNSGKKILASKNEGKKFIEYNSINEKRCDTSVFSLLQYLRYHNEFWIVNSFVKNYIMNEVERYLLNSNMQFGGQVFSNESMTECRNRTFSVLYMLLGGLKKHHDISGEIGISYSFFDEPVLSYASISEWLNRILRGNIIFPKKDSICFWIMRKNDYIWSIQFNYFDDFDENNGLRGLSFDYLFDDLICINESKSDALQTIKNYLLKYIQEGEFAYKIKKYKQIVVGTIGKNEVLFSAEQRY